MVNSVSKGGETTALFWGRGNKKIEGGQNAVMDR